MRLHAVSHLILNPLELSYTSRLSIMLFPLPLFITLPFTLWDAVQAPSPLGDLPNPLQLVWEELMCASSKLPASLHIVVVISFLLLGLWAPQTLGACAPELPLPPARDLSHPWPLLWMTVYPINLCMEVSHTEEVILLWSEQQPTHSRFTWRDLPAMTASLWAGLRHISVWVLSRGSNKRVGLIRSFLRESDTEERIAEPY